MNIDSGSARPDGAGLIAIVDDDEQISAALGTWFELCDLRTTHHASGESLLNALHRIDDGVYVKDAHDRTAGQALRGAVLDLNLDGMNGMELAHALRELHASLPIVIITAMPRDELERYGPLPHGVTCLKKPFDLDALEHALFAQAPQS